jgi:hypothetical protein
MLTCPSQIVLTDLDISDPFFTDKCEVWTRQMRSEMAELVATTRHTIAESRRLMAEVDRLIASR